MSKSKIIAIISPTGILEKGNGKFRTEGATVFLFQENNDVVTFGKTTKDLWEKFEKSLIQDGKSLNDVDEFILDMRKDINGEQINIIIQKEIPPKKVSLITCPCSSERILCLLESFWPENSYPHNAQICPKKQNNLNLETLLRQFPIF